MNVIEYWHNFTKKELFALWRFFDGEELQTILSAHVLLEILNGGDILEL